MSKKPKYHVFGHIHESYGEYEENGIKFLNVSHVDVDYKPVNKPVVIEI